MPQPPALTPEQRVAALARAAEVLDLAERDELVAGIKVLAILESVPGVGKVTARRTMDEVGIADTRRIRGLGEQQRRALLAAFG